MKLNQEQLNTFVLDVLKSNELMKQKKKDYSDIRHSDAKKETEKKLANDK